MESPGDRCGAPRAVAGQVVDLGEQAVQGRLVGDRPGDQGHAAGFAAELQPVEPGGPALVEQPLYADLVTHRRSRLPLTARAGGGWAVGPQRGLGPHHLQIAELERQPLRRRPALATSLTPDSHADAAHGSSRSLWSCQHARDCLRPGRHPKVPFAGGVLRAWPGWVVAEGGSGAVAHPEMRRRDRAASRQPDAVAVQPSRSVACLLARSGCRPTRRGWSMAAWPARGSQTEQPGGSCRLHLWLPSSVAGPAGLHPANRTFGRRPNPCGSPSLPARPDQNKPR